MSKDSEDLNVNLIKVKPGMYNPTERVRRSSLTLIETSFLDTNRSDSDSKPTFDQGYLRYIF